MTPEPHTPFPTFFGGGFECSTHRRCADGGRVDIVATSGHLEHGAADYARLAAHGMRWARDGFRWHLIEARPGRYDWSTILPLVRAARDAGVRVAWDLCHWGYPDWLDLGAADFPERFAAFARAAAALVQAETDEAPVWCPINEISFWSWAAGHYINPCGEQRPADFKRVLVRAALAAAAAVRDVDPRARLLWVEPVIHIVAHPDRPQDRAAVEGYCLAQYEAWDMIAGRRDADLGGSPDTLDLIGVNYYWNNQWVHAWAEGTGGTIDWGHPQYRPLRDILAEVYDRYGRPFVIAETGTEGERRPAWLGWVCDEAAAARAAGADLRGLCLYPVCDHPGWDDARYCPNGLFGYADAAGRRPVYAPLAAELRRRQPRFGDAVASAAEQAEEGAP